MKTKSYNPKTENLRDTVEKVLIENNQWSFKSSGPYYFDKTLLGEVNVNSRVFFTNILKDSKVTWGLPGDNPLKAMNFLLYKLFGSHDGDIKGVSFTLNDWILEKARLNHQLRLGKEILDQKKLKPDQDKVTQRAFKDLDRHLKMIDLEILIQQTYNKTLMGTPGLDAFRKVIWRALLEQPVSLSLVEKDLFVLKPARVEPIKDNEDRKSARQKFEMKTKGFSAAEMQELKMNYPEIFKELELE